MFETEPRPVNLYVNLLTVVLALSVPLYRAWVSLAVPLIMLLWLFEGDLRDRLARVARDPVCRAVGLFIAVSAVSIAWSADRAAGLEYVGKYRYLLLVPMLATSLRPRFARAAESALLVGASAAAALSFTAMTGALERLGTDRANPSVTMSHLDFSMILTVAALLALNRLVRGPAGWQSRLPAGAAAAGLVACLASNLGRSGQAALAVTLPVMACIWSGIRSWRRAAAAVVMAVIALGAVYIATPRLHERIDDGVREVADAVDLGAYETNQGNRVAAAMVAAEMIRRDPLLGTGVGANMAAFRALLDGPYADLKPAIYWYPHLHNQYLQVATEAGLVGLAALLWMMFRIAVPDRRISPRGALLSCAFLVGFLGDPYLHKQLPLVLFALLAGIDAAARVCPGPDATDQEESAGSPD